MWNFRRASVACPNGRINPLILYRKMDLHQFADTFGGIPLFLLLIVYFMKNNKTAFQKFLLFACIVALVVDVYLSFFWKKKSLSG